MENYFPSKKVQLRVDKEEVVKKNAVPAYFQDAIVSAMEWEIPNDHLTRADLTLLSVLENNHWDRPIYFRTCCQVTLNWAWINTWSMRALLPD
jgi:uncharacterized protein YdeI (YjbR/CyaY-like superfamily)